MARVYLGLKCNAEKREADPNVGLAGENGRYPQVAFESAGSQKRTSEGKQWKTARCLPSRH